MKNEHFRLVRRRNHPFPGSGIASGPHQMAIVSRARDVIPHQTRTTSGKPLLGHPEVITPSRTTLSLPDCTMSPKSLVFCIETEPCLGDPQLMLNLLQGDAFGLGNKGLHPDELQHHHCGEEREDVA